MSEFKWVNKNESVAELWKGHFSANTKARRAEVPRYFNSQGEARQAFEWAPHLHAGLDLPLLQCNKLNRGHWKNQHFEI